MSAYYPHEGRQPGGNRTPFSLTFANSNEKPPFISVMDAHINSLEDDYLWMFKERVKLEEQYADSLAKLTMRTKALDSGTDQLGFDNAKYALPTVRSAWRQIRENSEQEVEARRAFANSLKEEVIKPLMTMKATQSRISSRIAEDVKNSKDKYNDKYSELQKLHKAYFKKSADYHEFSKDLVSSGHSPSTIPSPPPRQQALSHYHTPSILTGDRGSITPQALAQEAKKGFSQLISGLRGAAGGTGGSTSIGAGM
ncbi:FCH domain, partial [Phaffia rhodozyma]